MLGELIGPSSKISVPDLIKLIQNLRGPYKDSLGRPWDGSLPLIRMIPRVPGAMTLVPHSACSVDGLVLDRP